jgi:Carboxypeptidase regulatory-like domain
MDTKGYYLVSNLIAGDYTVRVVATGFKAFVQKNVAVNVGSPADVDVRLVLGASEETVAVSGAPRVADHETRRAD